MWETFVKRKQQKPIANIQSSCMTVQKALLSVCVYFSDMFNKHFSLTPMFCRLLCFCSATLSIDSSEWSMTVCLGLAGDQWHCITVKPRYLATFDPGHNFGERRGWRLNGGSTRMRPTTQEGKHLCHYTVHVCAVLCLLLADTAQSKASTCQLH